jgi:hypothetical protein
MDMERPPERMVGVSLEEVKNQMKFILILMMVLFLTSCSSVKPVIIEKPVYDIFVEMGKKAGCFDKKQVTVADGRTIGCFCSSSRFDKELNEWITTCEPLCPWEAPECYADGWKPDFPKRCSDGGFQVDAFLREGL